MSIKTQTIFNDLEEYIVTNQSTPAVGDTVKTAAAAERLPVGTVVGLAHPAYQAPKAAVRVEDAFGRLSWELTGSEDSRISTHNLKQWFGGTSFVILALPGQIMGLLDGGND